MLNCRIFLANICETEKHALSSRIQNEFVKVVDSGGGKKKINKKGKKASKKKTPL